MAMWASPLPSLDRRPRRCVVDSLRYGDKRFSAEELKRMRWEEVDVRTARPTPVGDRALSASSHHPFGRYSLYS